MWKNHRTDRPYLPSCDEQVDFRVPVKITRSSGSDEAITLGYPYTSWPPQKVVRVGVRGLTTF